MLALVNSHSGKTLTELHFSLFIGRDGKFCVKETQTDVLIRSDDDLKQFYAIAASDLK